CQQGYTYPDSF
nr:immunoglobulin light chain junction region [Macaca mulatta]